jgi:CHAT domain-containing protein
VVVSACESGRISIGDAPNEFRGLPFALIACGAASVVASLWPVNDLATALLMVRFHEELTRREGADGVAAAFVADALGAAQAWLRTATHDEVRRFMARHGLSGAGAPASAVAGPGDDAGPRPFAAPRHWAAFVAVGC